MPHTATLGFSTLGCPGATTQDIIRIADQSGCRAVELRAADEEPFSVALSPAERRRIAHEFRDAGIQLISVASYVRVADGAISDEACLADLREHCALAHDLGATAVRVFPGAAEPGPAADDRAIRRLRAAARTSPVLLLLETHDSHRGARDVARVLRQVGHPSVGAIWDVLHTWLAGENPDESAALLRPWLRLVQLKDVPGRHDRTPVLPGEGTVPLEEILTALQTIGYHGQLSLELETRWHPGGPPLLDALRHLRKLMTVLPADPGP
ncbi:sugar phosphate isomerase/epimerase [Streptomyces sp. PSKA54]|uniref:Sugar phosphate isomerase/epimerase n=1 Tax=Streptomyces himalayensis subsp. aureolus TaxID=2758039 RepID=A0A7W2HEH5_9ACTN|nr:sugar phosphate isomerase/epimerase family protein [Streptomyces himalayensis]MBA4860609.1 sugar phosphate isomerase/epimerase [Streptomyces himalayensis subsp. aureolus]